MRLALAVLLFGMLAAPARADVIVVDISGQGHFTGVQAAVDAAADGDILLIRSGDYTGVTFLVTLQNKSLTLVGDGPTRPILPPFGAYQTPAGSTTVLRFLEVRGSSLGFFLGDAAVAVTGCSGAVLIEDCTLVGMPGFPVFAGGGANSRDAGLGLRVTDSPTVAIQRSTIRGGAGSNAMVHPVLGTPVPPSHGGVGVLVVDSRVAVAASTLAGGHGGNGHPGGAGRDAGHGIDAQGSLVHVTGCDVSGGNGGDGAVPGLSGAGVRQDGATASLRELDNGFAGGSGAPDVQILDGEHLAWPGESVVLSLSSPLRDGQAGALAVSGPPGTLFALFWSFSCGHVPLPGFHGVFLPGVPFNGPLITAVIPGGGELLLGFTAPAMGGVVDGFLNIDQVLTSQPGAGLVLGSAGSYVQVDPAF